MAHQMIRNAHVVVNDVISASGRGHHARITINDKITHDFSSGDRLSRALGIATPEQLSEQLTGGTFFTVDDQIVAWRDRNYTGFVHTDETVDKMVDLVGYHVTDRNEVSLRQPWNKKPLDFGDITGLASGSNFDLQLLYRWNPFERMIRGEFDLTRLICANGMIGNTRLVNSKIPVINRWEEHLGIAEHQMMNQLTATIGDRMKYITSVRASVGDVLSILDHACARMDHNNNHSNQRDALLRMITSLSPVGKLTEVYGQGVFKNRAVADQVPAHITLFDAYNAVTELRSHTNECDKSTNNALDVFANRIMFDRQQQFKSNTSKYAKPSLASYIDCDAAFIGE